ncbi:MAG TPA: flagellar hook-basal body complex protein FliE [Clostridia bacterium]|nr:flagellar hook-basal body complex protein FliE [Clostridia bacterium]
MAVNGVNGINTLNKLSPSIFGTDGTQDVGTVDFSEVFKNALNKVNDSQLEAEQIADDFAAGKTDDINAVMISATKADLSLQLALQIRNKLLDAYNEIMRMQI